jgi:gamma-glutamylputrescine oxidase
MTTSYWRRTTRLGVLERDVTVVGGGICGISAGLHLSRRGARVAVVERGTVGCGASQRNAGFLMRGAADNYAAAVRAYGRSRARQVWRWTEENLAGLRSEGIESLEGYQVVPSCLLALGPDELTELRNSAVLLEEDGFGVGWIERGGDSVWRSGAALGGLVNPDDAACNPWALVRHLASKLPESVLEQQEVTAIRGVGTGGGVEVATSDARVWCRHVLVCTNAYAPLLLPSLRGVVSPRRGQMMAVRCAGGRLDYSYYANHGSEYMRQTADGTIVVGGCRMLHEEEEVGYEDMTTDMVQRDIERFAGRMLGEPFEVIARWAGTMGFSPDGLPLVGAVSGDWPRGAVWFCGGFTGHGMSMAYRASSAAVASMVDGEPVPLAVSGLPAGAA